MYNCNHSRIYVDKPAFNPLLTIIYCGQCHYELARWTKYMEYISHYDEMTAKKLWVFGSPADYSYTEKDRINLK